jgi:inositol-phosphate transport system ATP-binding protein
MSMCDRIAIMKHGRIVQVDTPVHMYRNPRTEFVAGFLGNPPISFIGGSVDARQFVNGGARIALGGTHAAAQGPARAGLRPEHVTLVSEGGNPATVSFVEHQGREILYDLQLANGDIIRTLQSGGPVLKAGETVQWHIEANDVLFFDALGDRLHVA